MTNTILLIPKVLVTSGAQVNTASTTAVLKRGSLGVFRQLATGMNPVENVLYTCEKGSWVSATPVLLTRERSLLVAYYPYVSEAALECVLVSNLHNRENYLCTTTFVADNRRNTPVLTLLPVYARLRLKFMRKSSFRSELNVSSLAFLNLPQSASYNLLSGVTSATVLGFKRVFTPDESQEIKKNEDTIDLQIIPAALECEISMIAVINEVKYTAILPANLFLGTHGDHALLAGHVYAVQIWVDTNDVIVDSIPLVVSK